MHSKSNNLGYLKDQRGKMFWGLRPLVSLGGRRGSLEHSKPFSSEVLASLASFAALAVRFIFS